MKEIKSTKKPSILKKIFINICRVLGYELIDQSSLEFPVSDKKSKDTLSIPGKRSFSLGVGEFPVTRKVQGIDIILKTCTSVQLVSQNKNRVFEKEKSEYTFRTLKSLYKSALDLKRKFPEIFIQFTIIDIGSDDVNKGKLKNFLNDFPFKFVNLDEKKINMDPVTINKNNKIIENNMATTMKSIYESFDQAQRCKDLIYFVEDDYIHKTEALAEMIFAYEKFSSIFNKELFILSTDYPYLYKKLENSNILIGENYHWRTVNESLLTFLTSNQMFNKYREKFYDMAKIERNPFEKNLHEIFDKEICLSPLPSLSIHCSNVNSVFGLSPNIDIKDLWDKNKI